MIFDSDNDNDNDDNGNDNDESNEINKSDHGMMVSASASSLSGQLVGKTVRMI